VVGRAKTTTNTFASCGTWDGNDQDWKKTDVADRRYIVANIGYCLVKSATINQFASRIAKTGALIGITSAPDPDIPPDFNIIIYPIDNTYTKQGTLDRYLVVSSLLKSFASSICLFLYLFETV